MTTESTARVADWLTATLGWKTAEFVSALSGGNSNLTWLFRDGERACVVRTPARQRYLTDLCSRYPA